MLINCGGGGSGGQTETGNGNTTTNTPADALTLSTSSLTLSEQNSTEIITITASANWKTQSNADWLSLSSNSGTGDSTVTLTITRNDSDSDRLAELAFTVGTVERVITVSQRAAQTLDYEVEPDSTDMRAINSSEFTQLMGIGFNIGNSLDAVGGEIAWGNPLISETFIDALKSAGFNAIRLPVAWSQFSDADNYIIEQQWLQRVEQVVNYALEKDMYVMMNIHWDSGWMQPTNAQSDYVNNRLAIMWQQIATHFRDYNDHLLFAGTNEVMVTGDYSTPTAEYYTVQNSFNQTFVDTVRKTGGRNTYRQLIVQGFNTNIDHTVNFVTIPTDTTPNRLMMEVHYYDPYDFTLNQNNDQVSQWGSQTTDASKAVSGQGESYVDGQFLKMRTHFHDQGIGVILGEYGAISRDVVGHDEFRIDWHRYVTQAAVDNKLVPFYWDNGYTDYHELGLFNRATGEAAYPKLIEAITSAAP